MFTIIISEKGGAERREAFDRNEINVGRVQGNDLMLPKGNVSKHHARLLYRDGRFIVTDLKSTNGTYVNGRKISQATIVREGDKIYIGDFVLRLDTGQPATIDAPGDERQAHPAASRAGIMPRDPAGAPSTHTPPHQPHAQTAALPPPRPMLQTAAMVAPPATQGQRVPDAQGVSHFPLERDPDSESPIDLRGAPVPRVPGPQRLSQPDQRPRVTTALLAVDSGPGPHQGPGVPPAARSAPRATPQQSARRRTLRDLVGRVAAAVDLAPLTASPIVSDALSQEIELAVRAQAKAIQEDSEVPEGIDWEQIVGDALRELVDLGPIGPLLVDPEADEIHVPGPDCVLTVSKGRATLVDPFFTSAEAFARVVARLAQRSGEPVRSSEAIVYRRLGRGERMTAVGPPIAEGWTLTIRRPVRAEASLDELVRAGAMSRSMAAFLDACVVARANLLVVGPNTAVASPIFAALASAAGAGERIIVMTESDEVAVGHAYVTPLATGIGAASGVDTVRAATRLHPDRLVVPSLAAGVAAAVLDAIAEGTEGVVAGLCAPSLRQALARLAAQVALGHGGASIESAREAVGESFDIAIEVARGADGRLRVLRVAELGGADAVGIIVRDLFVSSADATGEGGFIPTGAVPRLAQDFAARGLRLDAALFQRK